MSSEHIGSVHFAQATDVDLFVETLEKYERGEMDADQWRMFRLLNGVYGQRQEGNMMLRAKVPAGVISSAQLRVLGQVAGRFSGGRGHVTTRQNIQFYFIPLKESEEAMRMLASAGITTKEACGHSVRSITASPLSGVDPNEIFDVTPYAEALTRHFLRGPRSSTLPRKFKIGFEGSARNWQNAAINDMSFFAMHGPNGERGFRVLVGGGTSTLARGGEVLAAFLPESELFSLSEAVIRVFHREGERTNRAKARIKWLIRKIGWDTAKDLILKEFDLVRAEGPLPLPFPAGGPSIDPTGHSRRSTLPSGQVYGKDIVKDAVFTESLTRFQATNVVAQKPLASSAADAAADKGAVHARVAVFVTLKLGDLSPAQFEGLASLTERYSESALRATIDQNVVLREVHPAAVPALYTELFALGLGEAGAGSAGDVTSCAGAHTCSLAVTASRGLGDILTTDLRKDARASGLDPRFQDTRIKISGCPNGCGQHHVASISLQGAMRKLGERALPLYQLSIGGGAIPDAAGLPTGVRFARPVVKLPAKRVSSAITRLFEHYEASGSQDSFDKYLANADIRALQVVLKDLSEISAETATEEDYIDLGQTEPFVALNEEA